jgi:hypothetical protein
VNIVHLSSSIAPCWQAGGPVRLFFDYINELSQDPNVNISVIGGVDKVTSSPYYTRVNYIPFRLRTIRFFSIRFYQVNWVALFKEICRQKPQLIVLNELRGQNIIAALLYRLIFDRSVEIRNVPCGHILETKRILYILHDYLVSVLGGKCIIYFAQNMIEMNSLAVRFSNCRLLPLSIKIENTLPKVYPTNIHEIKLISVGRNSFLKGFEDTLDLIRGIELNISYTVMSIPHGDHDFSSMGLNFKQADFTSNRFDIYRKYDIAILLPRIAEQTSLGLVEFLSVGIPVIYNTNADMPYVDGVCGVRIPSSTTNPQILKSAIDKIKDNYMEYSKNAIEVVFKHYNVENNARVLFSKN